MVDPEVPDALGRLRAHDVTIVALTNSTADVADDQLRHAGIRDLFDAAIVGADIAEVVDRLTVTV